MATETGYILGIARGHNAGACLLKDGEIVFAIEEERLSRHKYDGGPYAAMMKVKEYTDKLDYIFVAHTQSMESSGQKVDFTCDDMYVGIARKMGLIERKCNIWEHPQVIDLADQHHKIHAACAFFRSGFDEAVAVVIDGAGSVVGATFANDSYMEQETRAVWEVESIFDCSYPAEFKTLYKHYGCREPIIDVINYNDDSSRFKEDGTHVNVISGKAGIVKAYEAVTHYCGFQAIEAGKTMGLFPYGKPNDKIPPIFNKQAMFPLVDRNLIIPTYPNGASVNAQVYPELATFPSDQEKVTYEQNRRDMAYAVQIETQQQALDLILSAVKFSNKNKVVLSGGYGLNCVANYFYLDKLKEEGIELYVEPISNDGGTAIGAALWGYHETTRSEQKHDREIYLGPQYTYSNNDIQTLAEKYEATVQDATHEDIVELMTSKNIVALFQGRSENGPRALGNRSLLFDPTFEDGKDFVNSVKNREYFRPFAGSILEEDVHEWFDLRGMEDSPHMMYAVHCQEGIAEKIPSIIHVDGSCRIQTVSKEDNPVYHAIISAFKERTGVPIVFNTSFNLGGEPLVETLEDALWTLQKSDIEYLYLPEHGKLLYKGNWVYA